MLFAPFSGAEDVEVGLKTAERAEDTGLFSIRGVDGTVLFPCFLRHAGWAGGLGAVDVEEILELAVEVGKL